jgi:hypothetical protein
VAKYTAVGPFVFKRSKKKPKSVKALKPVAAKEQRRAFAQVDKQTQVNRTRAADRSARIAAKKEKQNEAVRQYFGLKRSGIGSGRNPIVDLQTGRSRLTTPQERSQTVKLKKRYVESKQGLFSVAGGTVRDPKTKKALKPYGQTTLDENNQQIRRSAANRRKSDAREKQLVKKKNQLTVKGYQQVASQGTTDKQVGQALKKVTDELQVRSRAKRNTEAEGMLAALDNLSRPYYGVNAAAKAAVKGKRPDRVLGAAGRGLALKDKTESWDVLEAAGVKNKYVKYGLGIPASFASDPLTYVSLAAAPVSGGGSLAALSPKAAKIASLIQDANTAANLAKSSGKARHARKAQRLQSKLQKQLKNVPQGPLTAKQASEVASKKSGIQLKVGARVPGTQKFVGVKTSGNTSAKVRNKIPRTARGGEIRDVAVQHMAPTGRMTSLTREESDKITSAVARENAEVTRAGVTRKLTEKGMTAALRKQLGIGKTQRILKPKKSKAKVVEARKRLAEDYDAGRTLKGHEDLQKYVEKEMAALRKAEQKAGLDVPELLAKSPDEAARYLPRYWKQQIDKKSHKAGKRLDKIEPANRPSGSPKNPQNLHGQTRGVRGKLEDLPEIPGNPREFARDIIGVVAKRQQASIEDVARKGTNDAIIQTGRKASAGERSKDLPVGQSVYKYEQGRLSKVDAVPEKTDVPHYVLKDAVKARADELRGSADGVPAGKVFDRVTGRWKGSVTVAWPGYYLRNLIGDTQLARQAGTDVKSAVDAARIAKAAGKRDRIIRKGKHITKGQDPEAALKKLTFKIDGKTYSGKELEDLATKNAAISTGQHGAEVSQLVGADSFSATNPLARLNIQRENLPRRSTFIADMKRGNSPEKAGAYARREHYDYATRTEAQKQIRRVIPFYAWWDLNTRKQLRMMATRPGKVNEIYHVMNGAASAAGYEDYRDYLSNLPAGKQRGLPIPIVYGWNKDGTPKVKDVQFGNVLSDLRTVFTGNGQKWADELLSRGNPLITKPGELATNHSGFFRGEIEPSYAPWAKAPSALKGSVGKPGIDTPAEKALRSEIVMRKDRKTGKMVPHYKKKTDYALRSIGPWAGFALGASTRGEAGPFQKSASDTLLGLTGVAPSEHDPDQAKLGKLYAKRGELQKISEGLTRVQGGTRRKKDLTRRINNFTNEISELEKKMGYAIPLNAQGGRKKKYEGPLGEIQKLKDEMKKSTGLDEIKKLKKDLKVEIGSAGERPKPKKKTVAQKAGKPKLGSNNPDLRQLVRSEAVKNGLDPDLEEARIQQESGFQTRATSSAGAQGVAQIMPGTAKSWGVDPNDPVAAIKVSSKKMAEYTKAHGSYKNALIAYNAGPGRVGKPLFAETAGYIQNISKMAGKSANRQGGKAVAQKTLIAAGRSWAKKNGLRITSTHRDPAHNASVGGVPNSYHTRGSKKNPAAMDFVGSEASMQAGAQAARAAGFSAMVHDAGSGRHLHVQNDGAGSSMGGGTSGGAVITPAVGGSVGRSGGRTRKSSSNPESGLTREQIQQQRALALLEYLQSTSKKSATKRLVRKRAVGELTTV